MAPFRPLFIEVDIEKVKRETSLTGVAALAYVYKRMYLDGLDLSPDCQAALRRIRGGRR